MELIKKLRIAIVTLLLLLSAANISANDCENGIAPCECDDTVVSGWTLGDLTCPAGAHGLTIGADKITIDGADNTIKNNLVTGNVAGFRSDTHTWLWTVSDTHSPILIYGCVQYTQNVASNVSVTVTNLNNTSYNVTARTAANSSYYQIRTSSAHIRPGDMLRFNASEGGRYSLREYTVTDEDVGGVDFGRTSSGLSPIW